MAPPTIYEKPYAQLGRLMVEGRRRGLSFEEWWEEAVRPGKAPVMETDPDPPAGAVRWPTDRNDRLGWQVAIAETREGWRRSFLREAPPAHEAALTVLADALSELDAGGIDARRPVASAA